MELWFVIVGVVERLGVGKGRPWPVSWRKEPGQKVGSGYSNRFWFHLSSSSSLSLRHGIQILRMVERIPIVVDVVALLLR
jgi:hypothetical protein